MAGEAERLQADNVALYEKVKFLESFDSSNSALAASGGGSDGYGSRKVPAGFEADTYPSSSSSSSSSPGKRRGGGGGATPSQATTRLVYAVAAQLSLLPQRVVRG